jgi:ABC-type dipeptide/oligopeptide/nickel transport system permease component
LLRYLRGRFIQLAGVVLGVSTALFFVLRLSGDPVMLLVPAEATPEQIEGLRRAMGFADPLLVQYVRFMRHLLVLDFGDSLLFRQPAMKMVLERAPATIELTVAAILLAVVVALPVGIYSATHPGGWSSRLLTLATLLGQSMPGFWLGILLILFFAVGLRLLPSFGNETPSHLILPALTLGAFPMARLMRLTRSGMLEVLSEDYIRTAYAKGLSDRIVFYRHALRNFLIPIVTIIGVDFSTLLGGAVLVESVFSWPGLGLQVVKGALSRDYPIVQATVFCVALMVVLINLAVDVVYLVLDPRIGRERDAAA